MNNGKHGQGTVPKWMLIVWPKMPQMPKNLSAQFVCPSPKVLNVNEKRLHWASVVPGYVRVQKNFSFFATIIAWKRTKDLAKAACHAQYIY